MTVSGTLIDRIAYDTFGEPLDALVGAQSLQFRSEWRDPASGLYYLRSRYLDPGTGRFLSRDSARPQPGDLLNLHRYVYAANDPVNLSDPSGHGLTLTELAVGFGIVNSLLAIGWLELAYTLQTEEWTGSMYAGYEDLGVFGWTVGFVGLAKHHGTNPALVDRGFYFIFDVGGGFGYRKGIGADKLWLKSPHGSTPDDMANLMYRTGLELPLLGHWNWHLD